MLIIMFLFLTNPLISSGTCSTLKLSLFTVKHTISLLLQNKTIQCVPTSAYSSRFITYAPSLTFLGRLFLEKTPLDLGSFWQYFGISKFGKGWGGIKNPNLFAKQRTKDEQCQLLKFLFLFCCLNQLLQFLFLLISFLTK